MLTGAIRNGEKRPQTSGRSQTSNRLRPLTSPFTLHGYFPFHSSPVTLHPSLDRSSKSPRLNPLSRLTMRRLPLRAWRNWQTRQVEGLVAARSWRFESSRPHHLLLSPMARRRSLGEKSWPLTRTAANGPDPEANPGPSTEAAGPSRPRRTPGRRATSARSACRCPLWVRCAAGTPG
jgi:hypothetical protein